MEADILKRPLALSDAEAVLAERFPEWAFSARELREMCDAKSVRCVLRPCKGMKRRVLYYVRIEKLLEDFKAWER